MSCLKLSYSQATGLKLISPKKVLISKKSKNNVRSGYMFGFNGQEKVNEWSGIGNFMDYKERGQDTRIARFLSVDPLGSKFPMLTPYQFASNTPIQAIDLDGKEAWFVHGTWSDPSTFTAKTVNDVKGLFNNSKSYLFKWSGENNMDARENAAERLASFIFNHRINGEKITILGHSHGGNVGVVATNILVNKFDVNPADINLITLNTPVREDYQLNSSLVHHFNIFNNQDAVQGLGGKFGLANRKYKNAINIKFKDQFSEFDKSGCGLTDHCGTAQSNENVWFPKLKQEVDKYPLRYINNGDRQESPIKINKQTNNEEQNRHTGQAVYGK